MKKDNEVYINMLKTSWNRISYNSIPDKVKNDREFKDQFNKLKLMNGPLSNSYQSEDYSQGVSGWKIDNDNGVIELNDVQFIDPYKDTDQDT